MYLYETTIINPIESTIDGAYYNMVLNRPNPTDASADYKKYLTRTLMANSTIDRNLMNIRNYCELSMETLYTNNFRKMYLFDPKRDIKDVYITLKNMKDLNIIGMFDFCTSSISLENAQHLPLYILFGEDRYDSILEPITVPLTRIVEYFEEEDPDTILTRIEDKTIEEIRIEKINKHVESINARFNEMIGSLIEKNDVMWTNDRPTVSKMFDFDSCNHEHQFISLIHEHIIIIFGILAYTLSLSKLLEESTITCVPLQILTSKLETLKEWNHIGDGLACDIFIQNFINSINDRDYKLDNPVKYEKLDSFYDTYFNNMNIVKNIFTNAEDAVPTVVELWDRFCIFTSAFFIMYKSRAHLSSLNYNKILASNDLIKSFVPDYNLIITAQMLETQTL